MKTYFVKVVTGTELDWYKGISTADIENQTFEQQNNVEEILECATREEAFEELAKHKNKAWFYGNSRNSNRPYLESEIFIVEEWEVKDGEITEGEIIAVAEWADINLD